MTTVWQALVHLKFSMFTQTLQLYGSLHTVGCAAAAAADGASSGRGRRGPYTPYDAFDAFQGTYQFGEHPPTAAAVRVVSHICCNRSQGTCSACDVLDAVHISYYCGEPD
jgi:hypothetical protein